MIERFLDEVRVQHQSKVSDSVLQDALSEIRAHLDESRDAFLATGKTLDEAESLAVKAFGDPCLAIHKPKPILEWRLTPACRSTVTLVIVSFAMCSIMVPLQFHLPYEVVNLFGLCFWVIVPVYMARIGFRARQSFPSAVVASLAVAHTFNAVMGVAAGMRMPLSRWSDWWWWILLPWVVTLAATAGVQTVGALVGVLFDRNKGRGTGSMKTQVKR